MNKIIRLILIAILSVIIIFCISALIWFYNMDGPSIETGKERAETIISALEKHKDDRTNFPTSLSALVPVYMISIPKPSLRHEYCYELRKDNTFTLAFVPKGEVIGDGWVVYWNKYREWERTDSDFCCGCHFYDYHE